MHFLRDKAEHKSVLQKFLFSLINSSQKANNIYENKRGVKTLKRARILLAMLLALSVFTFTGCGGNDANDGDNADNGTTVEDSVDKDAQDVKDDAEDMGEDIKDGAEDLVDGDDNNDDKATDNTEETKK